MKKWLLILFFMFVFSAGLAYAAPIINSAPSSISHKQSITITGSSFGVKNPAAPVYWNDYELTTVDSPSVFVSQGGFYSQWLSHTDCYASGYNLEGDPRVMFKNSSSNRWPGAPHSRSSKIFGGGFVDTAFLQTDDNCAHISSIVCASTGSKTWYVHYYKRYSEDFVDRPSDNRAGRDIEVYDYFLVNSVDADDTVLTINSSKWIPKIVANSQYGDVFGIENEKVMVVARNGNSITVVRGHLGSIPVSHQPQRIYMRGCQWNVKEGTAESKKGTGYSGSNIIPYDGHWQGIGLMKYGAANTFTYIPHGTGGGMHSCNGSSANEQNNPSVNFISGGDISESWLALEMQIDDIVPGSFRTYVNNKQTYSCDCDNNVEFQGWRPIDTTVCPSDYTPEECNRFIENDIVCFSLGAYSPRLFISERSSAECVDDPTRRHTPDNSWVYHDDVYADISFSRVMVANNQNYSLATIAEPQIPSAWNAGSITATVNLGALPDSGTAYLFVFDAENNHNEIGYPIQLGGVPPTHEADADSDGCVEQIELNNYIPRWYSGVATMTNLVRAIELWIDNVGC